MNLSLKITLFVALIALSSEGSLAQNGLSYEQKTKEIESLKAFEQLKSKPIAPIQAPLTKEDTDAAIVAGAPPKSIASAQQQVQVNRKSVSFTCDQTSEHNCELQEFMHDMKHGQNLSQEKSFVSNDRYSVSIAFKNDNRFPIKYVEENDFASVPASETKELQERIFEHYLGSDHASYSPELVSSHYSGVGITIHVKSSDDLMRFLDDDRVQGIHHGGNYDRDLEEGYN